VGSNPTSRSISKNYKYADSTTVVKKTIVGITVVGKDRGGIVAAFTNFAFQQKGNIEKVNQNVIKGLFGMYLEVSFTKKIDVTKFNKELSKLATKQKMEVNAHHEINSKKNIAVFVTREEHCLNPILDAHAKHSLKGKLCVVVATENTLSSLAKKAKIPFVLVNEKEQLKAEAKILSICKKYDIDLIVLARYMRILTPNFVWRYPHRIINIHPSLLPAFPGALAYAQAYERGTKIVGVTAHYVTEELDQGPIIFQDSFTVRPEDSLESIKKKGQKLEAQTLLKAVKMHLENKLDVRWRKVHTKSK
jgi:formyltetrahydrofolate deformylase